MIECELKPDEESLIGDDVIVDEDMREAADMGGLKKDMRKVEDRQKNDKGLKEDVSIHAGPAPAPAPAPTLPPDCLPPAERRASRCSRHVQQARNHLSHSRGGNVCVHAHACHKPRFSVRLCTDLVFLLLSLSLSLSHTHTHTFSLSHTHTHSLSLSLFLSLTEHL